MDWKEHKCTLYIVHLLSKPHQMRKRDRERERTRATESGEKQSGKYHIIAFRWRKSENEHIHVEYRKQIAQFQAIMCNYTVTMVQLSVIFSVFVVVLFGCVVLLLLLLLIGAATADVVATVATAAPSTIIIIGIDFWGIQSIRQSTLNIFYY